MSTFLEDAKKFVLANRGALEKAPLLIYSSLVLAPQSCLVRRSFKHCIPEWFSQLPTNVAQSWSDMDVDVYLDGDIEDYSEVLLFSPDGTKVAADGQVWDSESGHLQNRLRVPEVKGVRFSSSNNLQYVDWHCRLITLDLTTREKTAEPLYHAYISSAALSNDSTRIAICGIPPDLIGGKQGVGSEIEASESSEGKWEDETDVELSEGSELEGSDDWQNYGVEEVEVTDSSYEASSVPYESENEEKDENAEQDSTENDSNFGSSESYQSGSVDSTGSTSGKSVPVEPEPTLGRKILVMPPSIHDRADGTSDMDSAEHDSDWVTMSEESIGFAKRLIVWDNIKKDTLLETPPVGDTDPLLSMSPDGSTVAWCYVEVTAGVTFVQVFDIVGRVPRIAIALGWPALRVDKVMLSPSGDRIAIALSEGEVQIRDTFTGKQENTFEVDAGGMVRCLAFSSDGQMLLVAVQGEGLTLFNLSTGLVEGSREDPFLTSAAFSHDGLKVAISSERRRSVELLSTAALQPSPGAPMTSNDFTDHSTGSIGSSNIMSPDGSMLATVSALHNELILWDLSTGKVTDRASICFSPLYIVFSAHSTAIGVLTLDDTQSERKDSEPGWREADHGERWLEVWKVQLGELHFSFKRGPLVNWGVRDSYWVDLAKRWPPWAFNLGGARVALAPKVKVRETLTTKSVPLIEEWDVTTGSLIHTHTLDTPFLVYRVACSPVGFLIHYCGTNLVRGKDEIRHFEASGQLPVAIAPEDQSRLVHKEQDGWHRCVGEDESILAAHLQDDDSAIRLTEGNEWVRLGDFYALYLPHYHRTRVWKRMTWRSNSSSASNANEAVIVIFNQEGTLTAMKIDMDRYPSSSSA